MALLYLRLVPSQVEFTCMKSFRIVPQRDSIVYNFSPNNLDFLFYSF